MAEDRKTEVLVELFIPKNGIIVEDKVMGKLRTDKAWVKSIVSLTTGENLKTAYASRSFVYTVGEDVTSKLEMNPLVLADGLYFYLDQTKATSHVLFIR
jgi:hypothetical protein